MPECKVQRAAPQDQGQGGAAMPEARCRRQRRKTNHTTCAANMWINALLTSGAALWLAAPSAAAARAQEAPPAPGRDTLHRAPAARCPHGPWASDQDILREVRACHPYAISRRQAVERAQDGVVQRTQEATAASLPSTDGRKYLKFLFAWMVVYLKPGIHSSMASMLSAHQAACDQPLGPSADIPRLKNDV